MWNDNLKMWYFYKFDIFTHLDQPEASTVLHLEQKTSAEAAATDDYDSWPRFITWTGNIFTFKTNLLNWYGNHRLQGKYIHLAFFVQSPQLGLKINPPPIQEKPAKSTKKAPPTKEELCKMTVSLSQPVLPSCTIYGVSIMLYLTALSFFRRRWWQITWTTRTWMRQWMQQERWRLQSTSCPRCWTRSWSFLLIVQMRIRSTQAASSIHSAPKAL